MSDLEKEEHIWKKMLLPVGRHCSHCNKAIPMGDYDRIEVSFTGKYADLAKKFYGDSHLDFCSMDCLTKEMDLGLKNKPFNPTDEFRKRRMKKNEDSSGIGSAR